MDPIYILHLQLLLDDIVVNAPYWQTSHLPLWRYSDLLYYKSLLTANTNVSFAMNADTRSV